jgi:hypothetical protein
VAGYVAGIDGGDYNVNDLRFVCASRDAADKNLLGIVSVLP